MMRRLPKEVVYNTMGSPVGTLWMIASDQGLHAILWEQDLEDEECKSIFTQLKKDPGHSVIKDVEKQLKEYFAKKRKAFDIPLVMDGTEFQKKAWRQLGKIPYGKTFSYQEQAQKIGDAKKARAVGMANSRNPISIVVPCHRVIAKSGSLSGFAGGVGSKEYLLSLEQVQVE